MKRRILIGMAGAATAVIWAGCSSTPPNPNVERGPHGTIAYEVSVDASEPGAKIEANGEMLGETPLRIKIYGDKDGTFHDFGSYYYIVRAYPMNTNQFPQVRYFWTGRHGAQEDMIPKDIYFDMNHPQPASAQPPKMVREYDSPTIIYGPPYYYHPGVHFYFNGPLPPPFPFHHWH